MAYTRQYKTFLQPEYRVTKAQILPRNIYRISTYSSGNPTTKTGDDTRYVFVIGKVDKKIHCILLNNIKPANFTMLIERLRDKRKPILNESQQLSDLLKLFSVDGHSLFEDYIRMNPKVYSKELNNYRTYFIDNIQHVWEIRFEDGFLRQLFKEGNTQTTQQVEINEEITDIDD